MSLSVAFICWLPVLMVGFWDANRRSAWRYLLLFLGAAVSLVLSPFWQTAALAWWQDQALPFQGPELAFVSVWLIVLLPIARHDLNFKTLGAMCVHGIVAAAVLGLAVDSAPLVTDMLLTQDKEHLVPIAQCTVWVALFFTGFALCLSSARAFPWDYAAWFAGLMLMLKTGYSALALQFESDFGIGLLAFAYLTGVFLYKSINSDRPMPYIWSICGLIFPIVYAMLAFLPG